MRAAVPHSETSSCVGSTTPRRVVIAEDCQTLRAMRASA